ncbi:hypothetical protein JG687_00011070 [Phytophthora cactorum]|uniref:Uncharacterized protein n=1 Tax=Phytophthora cactorum TaxID=29920 RepID=A0A8T1U7V1_9STRA|nr:hypothetical protein JG687_00011070 [Phytophthora cactorum]
MVPMRTSDAYEKTSLGRSTDTEILLETRSYVNSCVDTRRRTLRSTYQQKFFTRFSILRLALRDSAMKVVCGSRLYLRLPFTVLEGCVAGPVPSKVSLLHIKPSSMGRTLCSIGRRLSQRALNCISKKIRKTNDAAQAAKRCRSRCSSPCSTASCGVLIGMVNRSPATFQNTEPTNSWFTSHTFCRAGAQYRFMYAQLGRRWSLRMIK